MHHERSADSVLSNLVGNREQLCLWQSLRPRRFHFQDVRRDHRFRNESRQQ
jgi:hypothetical protein